MKQKKYFTELESLRGIAALMICIFHVGHWKVYQNNSVVPNLDLFVDFFFVLSGFVITYNFSKNVIDGNSYKSYLIKRFFRLYPLFFVASIPYFFVSVLKTYFHVEIFQYANYFNFADLLFYITLTYKWGFVKGLIFNQAAWSISIEWLLYILAGLVFLLKRKRTVNMAISIFLALLSIVILALTTPGLNKSESLVLRGLFSFFLGSLIAYWFNGKETTLSISKKVTGLARWFYLIVTMVCLVALFWLVGKQPAVSFSFPFLWAAIIYLFITNRYPRPALQFLNYRYILYLGTISYSYYLIHPIMIFVTEKIFKKDTLVNNTAMSIVATFVYVGFTITIASLSYKFVELPGKDLYKLVKTGKKTLETKEAKASKQV